MTPRFAVGAMLLFASAQAAAQWWRADLEFGQDAVGLAYGVLALFAWAGIRGGFADSRRNGWIAVLVFATIAIAGLFFPLITWLLNALALAFLLFGVWRAVTGRQ